MTKFGNNLIAGMKEAVAYAKGDTSAARTHTVKIPDVRTIRHTLHMSQQEFAASYKIPLSTLKNWEQNRRTPDAPAAYLQAIASHPTLIREALQTANPTEASP